MSISRKHHKIVFLFFMALLISGIMSFVISVFNVDIVSNIIAFWLQAWGFAVAFPTTVIIFLVVHKLISLVLHQGTNT